MTATEKLAAEQTEQLFSLAQEIRRWQEAQRPALANNEMLRRFGGLGSTKTYAKLCRGDASELDPVEWLDRYRAVWALIEAVGESTGEDEELYDDLTPAVALRQALVDVLHERGNARVVVLEGDTGVGKTAALRLLAQRYGQRLVVAEASEVWSDSPLAMLGAILEALGVRDYPAITMMRMSMVVERLRARRVAVTLDEAHHLGSRCLNTLKTLVNQTPGEFILLAMPTLWRRMERAAYEEVRQLVGNRLAERIKIDGLKAADVRRMIERRCPAGLNGDIGKAASLVLQHAGRNGNLAFVRDVCRRVKILADDSPTTMEHVAAAVSQELASR